MKTEHSFVHAMGPARCHVGEGLLPGCSIDVKEARGVKTSMHGTTTRVQRRHEGSPRNEDNSS